MNRARLWAVVLMLAAPIVHAQTDVLTSRYDLARTSQNLNEPLLTPQAVNPGTFGKLYAFAVDGQLYGQPLVKTNLTLPGKGTFNAVFVATQHSSLYAIDADTATPLWRRSFINPAAGLTTRAANEDISPEVSITSTPVIDPASGTLYVVAETVQSGSPAYYWLHAIDITTGADKVPPVIVSASVNGGATPLTIDAATSEQRSGLVLSNGVVYVGIGSNGDNYPWVGWLVGYNATTLAQVSLLCTSPGGQWGAGIWSSGEAPPVDASGNLYFSTGNGYFNNNNSWGDSILKVSPGAGLTVTDFFTPFNQAALSAADLDVAAAGLTLLPDAAGSAAHPHLLVTSGKDGEVYLLDRDHMGGYNNSYTTPNTNIVQWIPNAIGIATVPVTAATLSYVSNSYTSPAFWQNQVYFCGVKEGCKVFPMANGLLATTPSSQTVPTFGYPGGEPVISAASPSATSAVLWAIERNSASNTAILHAFDATNLATELYNSAQAANNRDTAAAPVKFAVPTVANGKVFVATQSELDVYGLLAGAPQRLAPPAFTPAPGSYSGAQAVTLTAAAGAQIYYTLDGSAPTLASNLYSGPVAVNATTTISAMAVEAGWLSSNVSVGTFSITPVAQVAYVQGSYATPQTPQASVAVRYAAAQQQGDLNVVVVGWNDSSATVQSVTDSAGNTYVPAAGPTVLAGVASQAIYYAAGVAGAAAGTNLVTVSFSAPAIYPDVRIAEYSGIAAVGPLEGGAGASGSGTSASSPSITTTTAGDLLLGADLTVQYTYVGSGFTSRQLTVPDGDILEDRIATVAGSYAATATIAPAGAWVMQGAAFKPAGVGTPPPVPSAPGALAASANGATGINLSWTAATEQGGTIALYLIERCQGAGCSNFAQIGTSTATGYADAGLLGSTSYSYRVRAKDAAGTTGPYSGSASAVTATAVPGAPTNLSAAVPNSTQINLSWGAATEQGGTVSQYLIERCQGSGCSSFTQVGTASGLTYSDTGLAGTTNYSYRVRAKDSLGTTGAYSNIVSATTATATPTAPGSLAAASGGPTQVNLAWTAATETGGTISQYLIERCQGAGCTSFVQVGTASGVSFADTGLAAATSYSYRVRARDTLGNTGPYSNVATVSTAAATFTAPGALTAVSAGATQINLSWSAATESGGTISQYLIERCQGAGCGNFTQVGTASGLTYADTGLTGSTSYSYRVRAQDGTGSTSAYSNVASVTTGAASATAPTGLSALGASATQINLSWGAATESGGTISQYLIERCQGSGCSSFTQVGTASGLTYSDTGLTGSTNYTYRVRAQDSLGNTGPYSATASATTLAPVITAPTGLAATPVSASQINLSWGAATETGGTISQYLIERCQGAGCSTFTQVATAAGTTYNDAGLAAASSYSYRVRAADAAGNRGPYSGTATAVTAAGTQGPPPIAFVQQNYADPQAPQSKVTVRYNATQVAGDLNIVVVGWNDSTAQVGTVTDSSGNAYRLAVGPTVISATASQAIYYAANILGAAANTVTVTFTSAAVYPDIRVLEYSGIDPNNPLDVTATGTGNSGLSVSAAVNTTYANDLIFGANLVLQTTIGPGSGFTSRVITNPDSDIAEDRIVTATGSYSASAPLTPPAPWIMQLAAFRRHP
ncbi:MAG: fibronectin type III domain-containing protein [Proteobacteria bacterium]|nr:fibronectin type III domain-containing protein [Pseudomonadota bacterium]